MADKIDITGQRFGKLVARESLGFKNGKTRWLCDCDCGNQHSADLTHLRSGHIPSCGCLRKKKFIERNTTHGYGNTKIHQAWLDMHSRCYKSNHKSFHNYGGRGITVSDDWHGFEHFLRDMESGCKKGLTLDRIDNNKGYSKENCRWITHKENCRNKRTNILFELDGELRTLREWAEIFKINASTLYGRVVRRGYSLRASLSSQLPRRKPLQEVLSDGVRL